MCLWQNGIKDHHALEINLYMDLTLALYKLFTYFLTYLHANNKGI